VSTPGKVKQLLSGKFSPAKINNGPSNVINQDLINLLLNPLFQDEYMTSELEVAIEDYLEAKALTVLGPSFEDEEDYPIAIAQWALKESSKNLQDPLNRGLFELLVRVNLSDKKINYITYDQNNQIILKKIDPKPNLEVAKRLTDVINKSIKDDTMDDLLSNTFLSRIIRNGYSYEKFKLEVSKNLSKRLKGSRSTGFGSQITLSEDFLGASEKFSDAATAGTAGVGAAGVATSAGLLAAGSLATGGVVGVAAIALFALKSYYEDGAGDGPLSIVYDGDKAYLSKEFNSVSVTHATTIPASKITKFKEVTGWEKKASFYGKKDIDGDDKEVLIGFSDEQIDAFADAINEKDITANQFNFYDGEFYDSWGLVFDGDWWEALSTSLAKTNNMVLDGVKKMIFEEDTVTPEGDYIVNTTPIWKGSLLKDFQAEREYPPGVFSDVADVDVSGLAGGAGSTALGLGLIKGAELASYAKMASVVEAAGVSGGNYAGWLATEYGALVEAGKVSRGARAFIRVGNVASKLVTTTALGYTLLAISLAWWGYSIWNIEKPNQQDRLNKLVLRKYLETVLGAIEALANGRSIGRAFRQVANEEDFLKSILSLFALDKEVERRVRLWNRFSIELRRDEDFLEDDNAVQEAIDDSIARGFSNIELPDIEELTDEQIQDRQKFYKQCALMMNLHKFAPVYESYILDRQNGERYDGPDKTKPFGGRFWRATSKNKEKLINNLFSSDKSQYLFEIPPHVMSQLVPKFRLYKVLNDRQTGKLTRTEFIFPTHTDLSRTNNFTKPQSIRRGVKIESEVPSFLGPNFDKGDGVGLKSFTLEFNGTNPAEARNDVQGSLSLYFQSFADFIRERIDHNGNRFSYVDLIVQPEYDDGEDKGTIQGVPTSSLREYDPSFYRIMVETGYIYPESIEGISGDDLKKLQSAIKNMNKSFYLCMVDHEFKINNDGTVEVSLTYRAYIETALKTLRFDALTTPELAKQRIINQTKLYELATSQECTIDQLQDVKVLISSIEEEIIKNSLNSIMTRLFKRDKIFVCQIDDGDRRQFLNDGYFRKCDIVSETDRLESEDSTTGDLGVVLNTRLPEKSSGFDFNDSDENDTLVQFFFFGDLLHTILDALYIEEDGSKSRGLENTMIVLGSFDFEAFQNETGATINSFNISQIPISVEFFSRWFVENVINQKSTRRSFPILNFIRNLSNALVSNSLLESCVNRDMEQRLIFQTGQFSCYNEAGADVLGGLTSNLKRDAIIDTDNQRGISLPLEGSPAGDSKIENFHHYIVLNPNGSTRNHDGRGIYSQDIGNGVFHMEIGSNRGIVKTINFSKTDMQYLREARFIRNGVDGLMQLSSVYNVSIEMFGNTLFYPGMDLWLNPYGFGGTTLGSPTQRKEGRSLANILGIGGYHTITKVSVNLTPSSFTTSIQAQHYYSGDGEMGSLQPKISKVKGSDEQLIEMGILEEDQTVEQAANCLSEIVDLQNFGNENATAFDREAFIDSQTSERE